MNRAVELGQLQRLGEARAELEACLQIFQNDRTRTAVALSSLADLLYEQGDVAQAIAQHRRALALRELLPDPAQRAISHNNLAVYLAHNAAPSALAESSRHGLAALIYQLVANAGQALATSLRNYAIAFRHARTVGTVLAVPRVAELLADPAFQPLEQWLLHRLVNLAELQAAVDQFLKQAERAGLSQG